jgi:SAM-dependent methyltransferase
LVLALAIEPSVYPHAVPLAEFYTRHLERDRAESFGSVAEQYDRYRPAFPDALLDDLAAMAGSTEVLDVGSGTGKVARGLAQRGLAVLGVELDPRMAEVARGQGVRVEIARFEEWNDAGRRFDLLTCGDAWHWIEPRRGAAKVAQVLRSGGAFVRFWNTQLLDEPVMAALDVVYKKYAPEVRVAGRVPPYELSADDPFPLDGPFALVDARTYLSERRATSEDWAGFAGTISDHQRLPGERLALLRAAIREAVEHFGETIRVRVATTALSVRRA